MKSWHSEEKKRCSTEYKFGLHSISKIVPRNRNTPTPKPRSGHRIVCDDSDFYSFGGYNPHLRDDERNESDLVPVLNGREGLFKELWRFNYATHEWTKLSNFHNSLPTELASNAVILHGNTLIVQGGTSVPFGYTNSNKIYVGNLKQDKALRLLDTHGEEEPLPQYGQAVLVIGPYLYTVGGTTGFDYSLDIFRLDLRTNTWESVYVKKGLKKDEPDGRYRHEIGLYNGRIFIYGGGTATSVYSFHELPAFNLETKEWEMIPTFAERDDFNSYYPTPRRCHGCVQVPGSDLQEPQVIICGGTDGRTLLDDIWVLYLKTMQWKRSNAFLEIPMYFHSASLTSYGKLYIFGGLCDVGEDNHGPRRLDSIYSMWVTIPKLSEMCWESILQYTDITKFKKENLINAGIPLHFVNRIQ